MKTIITLCILAFGRHLIAQDSATYAFVNSVYVDSVTILSLDDYADALSLEDTNCTLYFDCKKIFSRDELKSIWSQKSTSFKWDLNKIRNVQKCISPSSKCFKISSPIYNKTKNYLIVSEYIGNRSCGSSGLILYQLKRGFWQSVGGIYLDW